MSNDINETAADGQQNPDNVIVDVTEIMTGDDPRGFVRVDSGDRATTYEINLDVIGAAFGDDLIRAQLDFFGNAGSKGTDGRVTLQLLKEFEATNDNRNEPVDFIDDDGGRYRLELFTENDAGEVVSADDFIALVTAAIAGEADLEFFETDTGFDIHVGGRWSTDILRFEGERAMQLADDLQPEPPTSHVLFSRSSDANGERDKWELGALEQDAPFEAPTGANSDDAAAYGLDLAADNADIVDGDDPFGDDVATSFEGGVLTLDGGPATEWNGVKNVEVKIGAEDLGDVSGIEINAFVDTRVQIGAPGESGGALGSGTFTDPVQISIDNVKRGELDASQSDRGVFATIGLTSNGSGWQNSFDIAGSAQADFVVIGAGSFEGEQLGGQWNAITDGRFTTITADLGAGNDVYFAGASAATSIVDGGAGNDVLTGGSSDDELSGGDGDDLLIGGLGNDNLNGGDGNDTFDGGDGDDVQTGGNGADRFIISTGANTITDFELGTDTLAFRNSDFEIIEATSLEEFASLFATLESDASGTVTDTADGVQFDVDSDKDGTLDSSIILTGISQADFDTGTELLIDFEEFSLFPDSVFGPDVPVNEGYQGFTWTGSPISSSPFLQPRVSAIEWDGDGGDNEGVSQVSDSWTLTRDGDTFDFLSGGFGGGLGSTASPLTFLTTMTVSGFRDGEEVYSQDIALETDEMTSYNLDFLGIDELVFARPDDAGFSATFAFDDLLFVV